MPATSIEPGPGHPRGNDTATFYDTTGNDIFAAWPTHAVMYGNGYFNDTAGFESTVGISSGGADQAYLNDSAGDDTYTSWWNRAVLSGSGYSTEARNFVRTWAGASTGNDTATFYDLRQRQLHGLADARRLDGCRILQRHCRF